MARNSSPSQLDLVNIHQRAFDETNDSIRVELGVNSGIDIQLDAAVDSVAVQGVSSSTKASLTSSSTGVVIGPISCVGMKSFQLYTNTTATISGAQALTLQVSPSDTDDVWIALTLTATPSNTSGTVVKGTTETDVVARRCRVNIAAAISSGTCDAYLVMQGV